MAWFKRKSSDTPEVDTPGSSTEDAVEVDDLGIPTTPVRPIGDPERHQIHASLEELAAAGIDVDDLSSLSQGLDAAYSEWTQRGSTESDHSVVVRRFTIGVGEHLSRHTDLDWAMVTDVFGTDLGLADGPRGAFVLVPGNIVASRWMRGETQWIPDVVGHLVRRRQR